MTEDNQIFMIESNSRTGVCLLDEQSVKNKMKNSTKVGYRKLLTKRKNSALEKL